MNSLQTRPYALQRGEERKVNKRGKPGQTCKQVLADKGEHFIQLQQPQRLIDAIQEVTLKQHPLLHQAVGDRLNGCSGADQTELDSKI